MLIIEVTPQDVSVDVRTIPAQGERPARTVYDQTVLFRLGGRSIIESRISHGDSTEMLQAGLYTLDGSSYQLGNFGNVELKKGYQQKIIPLSEAIAPYLDQLKPVAGRLEKAS